MYFPRNPHTPLSDKNLTSTQLALLFDQFNLWESDHPVQHQSDCLDQKHLHLYVLNMCCVDSIKYRSDWCLLKKAGSRLGMWLDSPWLDTWFSLAMIRLSELESGHNFAEAWEGNLYNTLWRGR